MTTTYWVCVAHTWLVPPVQCGARGTGDAGADRHSQKDPKHPTLTTTSQAAADRLAGPERTHA